MSIIHRNPKTCMTRISANARDVYRGPLVAPPTLVLHQFLAHWGEGGSIHQYPLCVSHFYSPGDWSLDTARASAGRPGAGPLLGLASMPAARRGCHARAPSFPMSHFCSSYITSRCRGQPAVQFESSRGVVHASRRALSPEPARESCVAVIVRI